jgi:rare lipoprotein A
MRNTSPVKTLATVGAAWLLGAAASIASMMIRADNAPAADSASATHNALGAGNADFHATATTSSTAGSNAHSAVATHHRDALDRTGRTRVGVASFYADRYFGRKMADGTPMRPQSNNAASITLPLGTTARVTDLKTGKSALVTIKDRGPYVKGHIIDLSPATARRIGLDEQRGLAKVAVAPIAVPLADGTISLNVKALTDNRG